MNTFDYVVVGLFALFFVCFMLWPYFSLINLKDIASELNDIKKELEKLNERIRSENRLG